MSADPAAVKSADILGKRPVVPAGFCLLRGCAPPANPFADRFGINVLKKSKLIIQSVEQKSGGEVN